VSSDLLFKRRNTTYSFFKDMIAKNFPDLEKDTRYKKGNDLQSSSTQRGAYQNT
jgi:hypothetical protein